MHSVTNHPTHPVTAFPLSTQRGGLPESPLTGIPSTSGLDFALNQQARRYVRPNRVRHPTGCLFASGCSPPRLAATQLPSAFGGEHPPEEDFHLSDHLLRGALIPACFWPESTNCPDTGFRRYDKRRVWYDKRRVRYDVRSVDTSFCEALLSGHRTSNSRPGSPPGSSLPACLCGSGGNGPQPGDDLRDR